MKLMTQEQQEQKNDNNNNSSNTNTRELEESILNALITQSMINDIKFATKISILSRSEQFIYTMQRWSEQIDFTKNNLRLIQSIQSIDNESLFDRICIPIGSYIHSKNDLNKYYLNLGVEAKTLQGAIYIGYEYNESFIDDVVINNGNFSRLISKYSCKPSVAIKYYDKYCCDLGLTLNGIPVKERAIQEIKITKSIYKNSIFNNLINKSLLPWLQPPHKNIIKLIENWEDKQKNCYFMITEFANCGELLLFIDSYHSIIYREKKLNIERIDNIKNIKLRDLSIRIYRESIQISKDGNNAYIELIKFLFQQMVQSIFTLHCQGIAHLDISCENFVLHFDENGQFLVKLIDFGRATKVNKKDTNNTKYNLYEFEKYDFTVSTYPGKCRYMSPESALFLKDKYAASYDASKEDIYALGVVLFCMLTCTLPYDKPFYIEKDIENPTKYGYLNGNKQYKIDIITMKELKTGKILNESEFDSNFKCLQQYGVTNLLRNNCLLDYVSNDSLDLLHKIFNHRISMKELINHKFVKKPPNPQLLMAMIQHVVEYKRLEYTNTQKQIDININQLNEIYKNRFIIQAKAVSLLTKLNRNKEKEKEKEKEEEQQQQQQLIGNIPIISPPIIEPSLTKQVIITPSKLKPNIISQCLSPISISPITAKKIEIDSNLQLNITQSLVSLASPSPPPQTTYICSPSPEIQFSPSPEPIQDIQDIQDNINMNPDHTNLVNNLLATHFSKTCN